MGELRAVIGEGRAVTEAAAQVSRELRKDGAALRALIRSVRRTTAVVELAPVSTAAPTPLGSARQAGQVQLVEWVKDGTLMASDEFATQWGMTPQGLHKAATRGELPAIKVTNRTYYPTVLCGLPRPFASSLGQALCSLSPVQQLIFLLRSHGALDGKSVAELTTSAQRVRALALAESWAAEERDAA